MSEHVMKNVAHGFVGQGHVGVTVRLSLRWGELRPGDTLNLWECGEAHAGDCGYGCHQRGYGRVLGVWTGPLEELPPELLSIEHEIQSRTWDGLFTSLERGYGRTISADEYIYAVIYECVEERR